MQVTKDTDDMHDNPVIMISLIPWQDQRRISAGKNACLQILQQKELDK
jgi:hypothetical protein